MNVAAEPLSRLKIRRITELREIAGCEDSLFFPIVHFIEWVLANPINGMELEIVEPEEMEDTYGTQIQEVTLCVFEVMYTNVLSKEIHVIDLHFVMSLDIICYINRNA